MKPLPPLPAKSLPKPLPSQWRDPSHPAKDEAELMLMAQVRWRGIQDDSDYAAVHWEELERQATERADRAVRYGNPKARVR